MNKILYYSIVLNLTCQIGISNAKIMSKKNKDDIIYSWIQTISEVCTSLRDRPFREVDLAEAFQNGLRSMIATSDAHSAFFSPKSYKEAIESASGEFSGIGISIITKSIDDDSLGIIDVIQGGPAEKQGLKPKDKIVEVDGEKLKGLATEEVISKLKGKRGTKVKIKILRDDKKPHEFIIKRDIIKDRTSLGYHFKDQDIYYLSLRTFPENASKHVRKLLKQVTLSSCNGLIIDLRRNPGGVLESAVDVAQLFLPKGSVVVITKDNSGVAVKKYKTNQQPSLKRTVPIFILIDNFTASASEILAGALRHYSSQPNSTLQVFLLGTPSFGKGSVQEVFPISNGCALKLTTMLYYLPNDTSIQACGIEPDFLIKPKHTPEKEIKWVTEFSGKESSLTNHITRHEVTYPGTRESKEEIKKRRKKEVNTDDDEEEKDWDQRHKEALAKDVQVQSCVNMISMLTLARQCKPKQVATRKDALAFLKKYYVTDSPVPLVKLDK